MMFYHVNSGIRDIIEPLQTPITLSVIHKPQWFMK